MVIPCHLTGCQETIMDWLICIGVGLSVGIIAAVAHIFSQWADEARKDGAIK